jgi:membrane associated rhomboid family serine protease
MAASPPSSQDRSARVVGALGGALVLAALGVLLTPGSRRGLAAVMALLGLLAGVAAAGLLPSRRGQRTPVERLNDGAFVVVLAVVSLLLGITARPWTMALPGLVGGLLAGRVLRRRPSGDTDEPPDRETPSGSSSSAA